MSVEQPGKDEVRFWHNVLRPVGAEPTALTQLRGGSGLNHDVLALGVDDGVKRLVIVSGEHDARSAILVQADIQHAFSKYRVLTIRPAAVNLPKLAQAMHAASGTSVVTPELLQAFSKDESSLKTALEPNLDYLKALGKTVSIRALPQVLELVQQLALLNLSTADLGHGECRDKFSIDLQHLLNYDPTAKDREVGVCAFPLFAFNSESIAVIASSVQVERVAETLRSHDILQFFFPGPDQLALGLIDRGIHQRTDVLAEVRHAPVIGHPLGPMEILDAKLAALNVLDALADRGLVIEEADFGFEVSEEGRKIRSNVKFKSKEGLISRLINRFSLKIELKNIFGSGKDG